MIPDSDYLQLYQMFDDLIKSSDSGHDQRVVLYQPDLFVDMAKEIFKLRQRILSLQRIELDYQGKCAEVLRLSDKINSVRSELASRHISVVTDLNLRSR